ncbi:MAG: hypothetical protein WAR24_23640, partial [Candidatus Acidiferrales bacterium]
VNLRNLPRRPVLATYAAPAATSLTQATHDADLVIRGDVVSIMPTAFDGTYVSVRIARSLKGSASGTVVIHQGGAIEPTPDWAGMFIADSEAGPLMIPGDNVVLFLHKSGSAYEPQAFTGLYWSTLHGLKAVPGNPFGRSVEAQTVSTFQTLISAVPVP